MNTSVLKLSIIIPCYNSSDFIEECLGTVFPYMNFNTEVIIINDGSTDDSLAKIMHMEEKFSQCRISVINQENAGLSAARNAGIERAKGEYLTFLDADDLYDNEFWTHFPARLNENSADIFEFDAHLFTSGEHEIIEYIKISTYSGHTEINRVSDLNATFCRSRWYAWARVYKTSLFKKESIRFPHGRLYEDMITTPALYLKCRSIHSLAIPLVWYRYHNKSITQTFRPGDLNDLAEVIYDLSTLARQNKSARPVIFHAANRAYCLFKYSIIKNKNVTIPYHLILKMRSALKVFIQDFRPAKRLQIYLLPAYIKYFVKPRKK